MHRLRTTFTRSRTPTGADMKTQSSLDVPKHVRSASFDEIKLEAQRTVQQLMKHHSSTDENTATSMLLQVPAPTSQRSRSFDSAGSDDSGGAAAAAAAAFLDIPRRFQRRRSSGKGAVFCIHCQYLEEYRRQMSSEDGTEGSSSQNYGSTDSRSSSFNDFSSEEESDEDEDEEDDGAENDCSELFFHPSGNKLLAPTPIASPCGITFTLSPTNGDFLDFPTPGTPPMTNSPVFAPSSPAIEVSMFPFSASGSSAGGSGEAADDDNSSSTSPYPAAACRQRRRSISRQEAIFVEPTGNSLENVSKVEETDDAGDETAPSEHSKNKTEPDDSVVATETSSNHHNHHQNNNTNHHHQNNHQNHHLENDFVSDIYLAVPDLKRDRAASVDSCFSKMSSGAKTEELQLSDGGLTLTVPSGAVRSRSVDIVLPTEQQARYKALALASPVGDRNKGKGYVDRTRTCTLYTVVA
jgi:diacylglycerol kinase (ATP)